MTRVADRLLGGLGPEWTVDLVGVGYGGPVESRGRVTLHPSEPGGRDTFGIHAAAELCRSGPAPDAVLVHHDLWLLGRYADVLGRAARGAPLLAYLPLDGEPGAVEPAKIEGLLAYRAIAVYTEWARYALERALAAIADDPPPVDRVGHGVDLERFRPAADPSDPAALARARTALKRSLLPDIEDPAGTLLVLNANRPDPRKRMDRTLEGFAAFLRRAPGARARLVLHHAHSLPEVDASLRAAADRLGIAGKVIFDPLGTGRVADEARLAELMAACEIGLNTSMGEAWGLLAFEHAATAAAQVLGRHSAHPELWEGAAVLVEPARRMVPPSSPLEMADLDPEAIGTALEGLHRDPERRHAVGLACRDRATRSDAGWEAAVAAFRDFVERAATAGP